jgi:molecular chaperone GrpE
MSESKQTIDPSQLDPTEAQASSPGAGAPQGEAKRPGDAPAPAAGSAAGDGAAGSAAGDGAADGAADVAAELQGDLDELGTLAAKRDEYLALAQRTQADFENYRKRVARESALAQERGVARLAKELLPALDNLDRALTDAGSAADGGQDDPLLDGVRLVRSELSGALARVGVESFSPLGESFDPAVHEAMATVAQPDDGAGSGMIVEVYEPGYRLGESIIRPARVVVAA